MKLLQNRHFKLSLLIAPVLAVLAYVGVGRMISETPSAAVSGRSYPLAAKSNCRYTSGFCTLENGDVELRVRARRLEGGEVELNLFSDLPVSAALVSSGSGEEFSPPVPFEGKPLQARVPVVNAQSVQLRWAVIVAGARYYAETSAVFVDHKTSFPQDNFAAH